MKIETVNKKIYKISSFQIKIIKSSNSLAPSRYRIFHQKLFLLSSESIPETPQTIEAPPK